MARIAVATAVATSSLNVTPRDDWFAIPIGWLYASVFNERGEVRVSQVLESTDIYVILAIHLAACLGLIFGAARSRPMLRDGITTVCSLVLAGIAGIAVSGSYDLVGSMISAIPFVLFALLLQLLNSGQDLWRFVLDRQGRFRRSWMACLYGVGLIYLILASVAVLYDCVKSLDYDWQAPWAFVAFRLSLVGMVTGLIVSGLNPSDLVRRRDAAGFVLLLTSLVTVILAIAPYPRFIDSDYLWKPVSDSLFDFIYNGLELNPTEAIGPAIGAATAMAFNAAPIMVVIVVAFWGRRWRLRSPSPPLPPEEPLINTKPPVHFERPRY